MVRPSTLHRVFLQSLLSRRAMTDDTALVMLKRSLGAIRRSIDPEFAVEYARGMEGLATFLEEASTLLEPFGMRIKRAKADDGTGWVVLANDETGDIGRMATDLSPLEISYFRALLEAVMLSHPANSVSNAQALRLTTDLKGNMSKRDAETLLGALTSRGWLARSKRGRYSLAPRAMIELDSYLREQYEEEIRTCRRCQKLAMTGVICANPECEAHYHTYCYEQLTQAGRDKCAACQSRFSENEPQPLGELSVPRREDQWGTLHNRRKRRQRDDEDELEDNDEELEQGSQSEDEAEHQTQTQSRSQSRSQSQRETIVPGSIPDESEPPRSRRRR